MKRLSFLLSCLLFSSISFADQNYDQRVKEIKNLQKQLIEMSPLVQACAFLIVHEMTGTEAHCQRIVNDFNDLVKDFCRMEDNLFQEKK